MTPAASCPPAAKPLPPHGTYARANGRFYAGIPQCDCEPCRKALFRYEKQRRIDIAAGRERIIDGRQAALDLAELVRRGMTHLDIAAAADCGKSTLYNLRRPGARVTARVADRLAQIRAELSATTSMPAFGAVRRARAAVAAGHTERAIAAASGLCYQYISQLVNGHVDTIRAENHARVATALQALLDGPAPTGIGAARARNRAAREGWAGPEMWDGAFDDPGADPTAWARDEHAPRRAEDIVADAEELHTEHGLSWEAAAAQVGVPVNTLHTYRVRVQKRAAATAAS